MGPQAAPNQARLAARLDALGRPFCARGADATSAGLGRPAERCCMAADTDDKSPAEIDKALEAYSPPADGKKDDGIPAEDDPERPVPITAFERRFRHPPGLFILFFAEMWERFSYYGMRGLLKLYMVSYLFIGIRQVLQGKAFNGIGSPDLVIGWRFIQSHLSTMEPEKLGVCVEEKLKYLASLGDHAPAADQAHEIAKQMCQVAPASSDLYSWYISLVYLTPVLGGLIADRLFGQRKTVVVGGILMAIGHFIMAFENWFFIALLFLIIGNGAFKPNISTQVGNLYKQGDPRRDGAFTIFYMGINIGATICNVVCGTLAAVYGWHYGFGAAGVGMCIGVVVYLFGQKYLAPDNLMKKKAALAAGKAVAEEKKAEPPKEPLTANEWKRVLALVALCALNVVFWAVYEQQGDTMQTWAEEKTVWPVIFGWQIPSTWFQSFNPAFIILFAPLLDMFWLRQQKKGTEPSSVAKMSIGCFLLGAAFIFMIIGNRVIGDAAKGSLFWPVACTLILTIGELYLSPIGLSLVTKVAPARIVSLMMGVWFLSSFAGNKLVGPIANLYQGRTLNAQQFFTLLFALGIATGLAIFAFNKPLKTAMGKH
jgi:POT family proton-dependent oligopeptide transporter